MKTLITLLALGLLSSSFVDKKNNSSDLNSSINTFIDAYSNDYIVNDNDDRFTSTLDAKTHFAWSKKILLRKRTSFKNHYDQTVHQRLYLFAYEYDKATKCQAAIDSLLSCFPNDCCKVIKGNDLGGIKITPSIFVLNDTEIIVCRIPCEHENEDWIKIQDDFARIFAKADADIITTECGGPLKWNNYKAMHLQNIKE